MVRLELPRRTAAAIVVTLLACAAAAWAVTILQAGSMGMGGVAMMSGGLFIATWLVMMIAMMFPAVAPMVLAFAGVTRARGEGYMPTAAFVGGYLIVWTATGVIPLAMFQLVNGAVPPRTVGAVIALAGIYQLTPLKDACLRACRSPLGFILTHDFGRGSRSAVRSGVTHGLYCVGCCWALMAVLAVIGLMNIAWMAIIAAVFFIEKNVRHGDILPRALGIACIVAGVAVVLSASLM